MEQDAIYSKQMCTREFLFLKSGFFFGVLSRGNLCPEKDITRRSIKATCDVIPMQNDPVRFCTCSPGCLFPPIPPRKSLFFFTNWNIKSIFLGPQYRNRRPATLVPSNRHIYCSVRCHKNVGHSGRQTMFGARPNKKLADCHTIA